MILLCPLPAFGCFLKWWGTPNYPKLNHFWEIPHFKKSPVLHRLHPACANMPLVGRCSSWCSIPLLFVSIPGTRCVLQWSDPWGLFGGWFTGPTKRSMVSFFCMLGVNYVRYVQDGAPKIAKLPYKWLYGRYNYS